MKNKSFSWTGLLLVLFFVIGLGLPLFVKNPYILHIGITIFIWSILTLGIWLVLLTGHLNAAQASFMGMGAYFSGLMAVKLKLSFWLCLPFSGMAVAFLALIMGYPILRVKGAYFVMITFAITEVFQHIWMLWESVFGGPEGLLGIPLPGAIKLSGFQISFISKAPFYYLAIIILLISVIFLRRLDNSRFGITLRSIPQAEQLAESVGVPVMRYKLVAFVIGSFLAGLAGSLWAAYFTYASPDDFTWLNSLYMLIYAVIGGTQTVLGPIVGCLVLLGLDEVLRPIKQYMPLILGMILILVLVFAPGGLITLPEKIRSRFHKE
jgi:branched-chain amino acid transport system permease protein